MITGKFMTSNDDIEKVLEIRGKVFPGSGTRVYLNFEQDASLAE